MNSKKFRAYIKDRTSQSQEYYLLLDEVQLLDGFVGTLNSLLRHMNFDIYVTGSNSRFLSSDIVTEFKILSFLYSLLTCNKETPIIPIKLLGIVSGGNAYETMLLLKNKIKNRFILKLL